MAAATPHDAAFRNALRCYAARLDITLEVGAVSESVDVTAQAVLLDSTTSSVGTVIDSTSMGTPFEPAQSVFAGVSGARRYRLDCHRPSAITAIIFRPTAAGPAARRCYGSPSARHINMVYKSGPNQIHGTSFEVLPNAALDANSFFNNANGMPLGAKRRPGGRQGSEDIDDKDRFSCAYRAGNT